MIELLDGNVLVALVLKSHIHHERCHRWFGRRSESFASCSVTQGTLLRLHMQMAIDSSSHAAWSILQEIVKHPKHVFWDDGFSYLEVPHSLLTGHRQITDAWLAALARRRGGKVATLDAAFAILHAECVSLVPVV